MLSYWEQSSFVNYDFIVVGGGIVGLSAALRIKELHPQQSVVVLERGIFPSGASTKNAGFACFGSLTELLADLEKMSESEVLAIVRKRIAGLDLLRKTLGDEAIEYLPLGGYELITEKELPTLAKIEEVNALLALHFEKAVFSDQSHKIKEFGFDTSKVKALTFNCYEGQIHTGKMMRALQKLVLSKGVEILTGVEILDLEDIDKNVLLNVRNASQQNLTLKAGKVAVCTNGFAKKLFPQLEVKPGRGQVLVTSPIPNLKFKGTFHYDEGFYYFRNHGNRVIFGGGRNLDFEGETTTELQTTPFIINHLKEMLAEIILPNQSFEIEQTWAGIMGFGGGGKKPILEKYSDNIALGVRMNGMGVAIGSLIGRETAELLG